MASPDSFYNAIWYADVLGRLISGNMCSWSISLCCLPRQGGWGLIFNSKIRPTYYVFQMYSHFGNEQVYAPQVLTLWTSTLPNDRMAL